MKEKCAMLRKLQEISFSLVDTSLYLDVYPNCAEALAYYDELGEKYDALANEYEKEYGPLTPKSTERGKWNWIKSPWPWEKED